MTDGTYPVHYGDTFVGGEIAERSTIHGSGTIDVEVDTGTGQVRAVWFRCRSLPFTVSGYDGLAAPPAQPPITVTAVEYLEDI